jgi:hypothetical protein
MDDYTCKFINGWYNCYCAKCIRISISYYDSNTYDDKNFNNKDNAIEYIKCIKAGDIKSIVVKKYLFDTLNISECLIHCGVQQEYFDNQKYKLYNFINMEWTKNDLDYLMNTHCYYYFKLLRKNNFSLDLIIYFLKSMPYYSYSRLLNKLYEERGQELHNYAIDKLKEVIRPAQLNEFLRKYVIYNPKSCYVRRLVNNF